MKKLIIPAILSLFCLSCIKEEAEQQNITPRGFSVTASIDGLTKVTVNQAGKTAWEEGDEIGVFIGGKVFKFILTDGAGEDKAVFSSDIDVRGKIMNGVAVYPYDESLALSGKQLTVKNPSTIKEGSRCFAPMAGKLLADGTYAFRNVAAILRLQYTNLPASAQYVKVTADKSIAGTFTLPDYETSNLEVPSTTSDRIIQADLPKIRPDYSAYVDIPVPSGTLSTIKAELYDSDGKVIDTHNTANKTFQAGVIKPLEAVTIPGDRMKVEWVWDNGNVPTFRSNIPAIDDNGNVYVSTSEGAIYKIDKDGKEQWRTVLPGVSGKVETNPSVEKDGSAIYYAAGRDKVGKIVALNPDGSIKWTFSDWPWGENQSHNFWQSMIGIGGDNLYVPVGSLNTVLTIRKADGTRVSYGAGNADGSRGNVSDPGSGCAVGLGGTVSYMTLYGGYTWDKKLLDNPADESVTWGKFALWGYRDLWPGWNDFGANSDHQGIIAAKKGPSTGEDIIISCAQESKCRIDVCCYPASLAIDNTLARHDDDRYKYLWRHQIGTNTDNAAAPAAQDQGGIVMGHENLVVIVPMKNRSGTADPKIGQGGLYSIWVGRYADGGGSSCWRVTVPQDVSGAAAIDNNGNVHFATNDSYFIVKPSTDDGGSYEVLAKINLRNLLLSSGLVGDCNYTGVWSSIKIAAGGKIYLNVNINSKRAVTCCFTYPGVTGPDPTSSWPQKGADQYNSCNQQI